MCIIISYLVYDILMHCIIGFFYDGNNCYYTWEATYHIKEMIIVAQ